MDPSLNHEPIVTFMVDEEMQSAEGGAYPQCIPGIEGHPYRWVLLPGKVIFPRCRTGRGWASVLNTQFSKGSRSSLENSR